MQPNFTNVVGSEPQSGVEIDLSDTLTFGDVICKTYHQEYSTVKKWFNDIRRTLAFVIEPFNLIYIKDTDSDIRYYIKQISHTELKRRLSVIREPCFAVPLKEEPKTKSENKLYNYIIEH